MDLYDIYVIIQRVIAEDLRIDLDYLKRKWVPPCDPSKHLFNREEAIWATDRELWLKVVNAYARWMLVDEIAVWHELDLMKVSDPELAEIFRSERDGR